MLTTQTETYSGTRHDGATLYLSVNSEQIIYGQKLAGDEKFHVQKITAYQYGATQLQKEADWLLSAYDWKLTSWDGKMVLN